LEYALEAADIRGRVYGRRGEIAAQQAEFENRRALEVRVDERRRQVQNLELRAAIAGQVLASDLNSLLGSYLPPGHELMSLGDESRKELVLSIAQEDADVFRSLNGGAVSVKLRGGDRAAFAATMGEVDPSATQRCDYLALTAAGGGPLAVRPAAAQNRQDSTEAWELVQPRLSGTVPLDAELSRRLRSGQLAMVKLNTSRGSLGVCLYRIVERWVRSRLRG
jgi:hypothetical protein